MRRFWVGFGAGAIVVAGVAAVGWATGVVAITWPTSGDEAVAVDDADEDVVEGDGGIEPSSRGRRRRGRRGGGAQPRDEIASRDERPVRSPRGEATTGDDLAEPAARTIDMEGSGGERQLSDAQIDAAFDRAFPRMRRCLTLAAGDDPVHGRVAFTVRIAPSGRVSGVRLSGPAAVTTGEAGDCLRGAARGISFPSFDGPEMTVRWHLTLD